MESPALGEALSRAFQDWGSATREQRIVAHFFLFSFFKLSESAWCQCKNDVLDEEQWVGWETLLCAMYHSKGVKEGWWQYGGNIVRTPTRPNFRAISRAAKSRKGEMRGLYDLFAPPIIPFEPWQLGVGCGCFRLDGVLGVGSNNDEWGGRASFGVGQIRSLSERLGGYTSFAGRGPTRSRGASDSTQCEATTHPALQRGVARNPIASGKNGWKADIPDVREPYLKNT